MVGNDADLVDELVDEQLRLNHLGSDILAVAGLEEVFDALLQEQFTILQIAGITRLEVSVGSEGLLGEVLTVVIASGNRRTLEQNLFVLANLDVDAFDGNTHTAYCPGLAQVVTADRCQRLRETIAYYHVDTDRMNELLHMRADGSACRGEEMGILQTKLLTYQREYGAVQHLVFQVQGQGRTLAAAEVFDVVFAAYRQGMFEELALHTAGMFDFVHDTHVDLLPEARHGRHTGGMCLTHGLLNLLRIGVDNHRSTLSQCQYGPSTLKDMGIGQEVHDTVLLAYRYAFVICLKGSMKLSVRQDDAFRVASGTAGIQDVCDVVVGGFLLQLFHFRLAGQVLAQLQEVAEIDAVGIVCRDVHTRVEDDDTLQGRTHGEDAARLVILVLFANEQEADLGIVDHELYLLLRAGGIERNGNGTDAPCTKVALKILH